MSVVFAPLTQGNPVHERASEHEENESPSDTHSHRHAEQLGAESVFTNIKKIWDLRCSSMVEFTQDRGFDSYLRSKKTKQNKKPWDGSPKKPWDGSPRVQATHKGSPKWEASGLPKDLKSEKPIIRLGMGFCIPTLAPWTEEAECVLGVNLFHSQKVTGGGDTSFGPTVSAKRNCSWWWREREEAEPRPCVVSAVFTTLVNLW